MNPTDTQGLEGLVAQQLAHLPIQPPTQPHIQPHIQPLVQLPVQEYEYDDDLSTDEEDEE